MSYQEYKQQYKNELTPSRIPLLIYVYIYIYNICRYIYIYIYNLYLIYRDQLKYNFDINATKILARPKAGRDNV